MEEIRNTTESNEEIEIDLSRLFNEIKKKHIEIVRLGASQLGKPVYEKYGFQQDNQWYSLKLDN